MNTSFISKLKLKEVGIVELLFACYPILAGYTYGSFHGSIFFLLFIALMTFNRLKNPIDMRWLWILVCFVALHEFLLMVFVPVESYFINNTLSILIVCGCIFPIAKTLDYDKLIGSLNWIAIISMCGILYHFLLVMSGHTVSPIKLPFMPTPASDTRLFEEGFRPVSFFWEPAAYVTFMMVPLFIALVRRQFIWASVITLSMFLSTSSTGILMSLLMIAVFTLTQKLKLSTRIMVCVMGAVLIYLLLNADYFSAGVEKIQDTEVDDTIRLVQGPILISQLSFKDLLLGFPAANVEEYYLAGHLKDLMYTHVGTIFVPTIYFVLAKYGVFGLMIFLGVYISLLRKDKTTLPYIIVLFVSMFYQSIQIGSNGFAYQLIFLYTYVFHSTHRVINEYIPKN